MLFLVYVIQVDEGDAVSSVWGDGDIVASHGKKVPRSLYGVLGGEGWMLRTLNVNNAEKITFLDKFPPCRHVRVIARCVEEACVL